MRSAFLPPSIDLHFFQILLMVPNSGKLTSWGWYFIPLLTRFYTSQVVFSPGFGTIDRINAPCPQRQPTVFVKAYGLHRGDEVLIDGQKIGIFIVALLHVWRKWQVFYIYIFICMCIYYIHWVYMCFNMYNWLSATSYKQMLNISSYKQAHGSSALCSLIKIDFLQKTEMIGKVRNVSWAFLNKLKLNPSKQHAYEGCGGPQS